MNKIIYLLSNPVFANKMGAEASKSIKLNYCMDDSIKKLNIILANSIK
jgi:hypothetical protein